MKCAVRGNSISWNAMEAGDMIYSTIYVFRVFTINLCPSHRRSVADQLGEGVTLRSCLRIYPRGECGGDLGCLGMERVVGWVVGGGWIGVIWWELVMKSFSRWLPVYRDGWWDWSKGMTMKGIVWNRGVIGLEGRSYICDIHKCLLQMTDQIHDVIHIHDEHFVAAVAYSRPAYSNTRIQSPIAAIMSSYC